MAAPSASTGQLQGSALALPALACLAEVRAVTLDLLADLEQERMDRRPGPGRWSPGEIADHLLRAEALNRGEIARLVELARAGREPLLRHDLTEFGFAPLFVPRFLLRLLSLPFAVGTSLIPSPLREAALASRALPTRAPEVLRPRAGRPADELRAALRSSLEETRALLAANPDLDPRRLVSIHPLLGTNDALGILRLTAAHERRHQEQLRDTLRALGAPVRA
jgi:hypothetical protein